MAVFTPLSTDRVASFLARYELGALQSVADVHGGTENSTFFVATEGEVLVLTLFEQGGADELPFFVDLLKHLADKGLPVPGPLVDRQGVALQTLAGKPALLFPRLPGRFPMQPTVAQCTEIGRFLGKMHQSVHDFTSTRENLRDHRWVNANYHRVLPFLSPEERTLMETQVQALSTAIAQSPDLPRGAIHGDLFRDNTLFEGDRLGGIIDFYNGCIGDFLFDLSIVINDWCSDEHGELIHARYDAVVQAYHQERPFTAQERDFWPVMLRFTALRYWLSRLLVVHVDTPAHNLTPKPPAQYHDLLVARCTTPPPALP